MKKLKFNKSKMLSMAGLLLTAIAVPTIAIVATSCSNTSTNSSQTLQHSYSPSSELKNIFSQQQYDDVYALLKTFNGSNRILNSSNDIMSKNYTAKSFNVLENSINFVLIFKVKIPNSSNFIQATAKYNFLFNVNTTDPEKLFSATGSQIIGSVESPSFTDYISKTIFETIVWQYSIQNWNDTLAQQGLHWEVN